VANPQWPWLRPQHVERSTQLKKHSAKIPIIVGKAYNDLSQAYSGGLVDVYKPTGENLYHSDVNSLYPFAMLQDMPVRAPVFTTETDLDSLFGFVLAKVIAPKGLKCPVLPCRLGERLICPIGSWEGWCVLTRGSSR